ncbi:uncharacterized protein CANTADRAFT_268046 [Suhomyces tanzawaensis NRRL Y-17324]|uniref:Uncharacterized protein n=1 Tax=Suhomyces tanzawaensis NRRL Y-17324 TaxID=984487 RepID=A0A1E4SG79_9ASCO|nr:uncharacterized protein CANTADRAFT_268046 [Suhomyces tanzawaensis NRRL Y-17324]ODV78518.1 hypothetical protein CANTADRAFT_268046 [Suhomyces tanzawaensis NRRL Y-17324]
MGLGLVFWSRRDKPGLLQNTTITIVCGPLSRAHIVKILVQSDCCVYRKHMHGMHIFPYCSLRLSYLDFRCAHAVHLTTMHGGSTINDFRYRCTLYVAVDLERSNPHPLPRNLPYRLHQTDSALWKIHACYAGLLHSRTRRPNSGWFNRGLYADIPPAVLAG